MRVPGCMIKHTCLKHQQIVTAPVVGPACGAPVGRGRYPRFLPVVRWVLSNRNRNHTAVVLVENRSYSLAARPWAVMQDRNAPPDPADDQDTAIPLMTRASTLLIKLAWGHGEGVHDDLHCRGPPDRPTEIPSFFTFSVAQVLFGGAPSAAEATDPHIAPWVSRGGRQRGRGAAG